MLVEFKMDYDFKGVSINVIENYINVIYSDGYHNGIMYLLPRKRKTLYLKYDGFLARPILVVGEDNYLVAPSKLILEYLKDSGNKIVSIVVDVMYNNYHYQVELFKDGRVLFSPRSIGIENIKKLVDMMHYDPDGSVLV